MYKVWIYDYVPLLIVKGYSNFFVYEQLILENNSKGIGNVKLRAQKSMIDHTNLFSIQL